MLGDALPTDGLAACAVLEGLDLPAADVALAMLAEPHDIVTAHERAIEGGLALRIDGGTYREVRPGLFAADGARIPAEVVDQAGARRRGRVRRDRPLRLPRRPAWIGPHARVNPHAWVRAGTAIGADMPRRRRDRGHRDGAVLQQAARRVPRPQPRRQLGEHRRRHDHEQPQGDLRPRAARTASTPTAAALTIHTGRQFLGASWVTSRARRSTRRFPAVRRIGSAATIAGAVPETVPRLRQPAHRRRRRRRSTPDQVATILERMMARRGLAILDADRRLLEALAARG